MASLAASREQEKTVPPKPKPEPKPEMRQVRMPRAVEPGAAPVVAAARPPPTSLLASSLAALQAQAPPGAPASKPTSKPEMRQVRLPRSVQPEAAPVSAAAQRPPSSLLASLAALQAQAPTSAPAATPETRQVHMPRSEEPEARQVALVKTTAVDAQTVPVPTPAPEVAVPEPTPASEVAPKIVAQSGHDEGSMALPAAALATAKPADRSVPAPGGTELTLSVARALLGRLEALQLNDK
jgi:hypothetical protein